MSDQIEITDEERELRRALNALRLEVSGSSIVDHLTGLVDAALATRKPVEDGRLLRRVEAFLSSITEWDGPSGDELDGLLADVRAALDQGGSDE